MLKQLFEVVWLGDVWFYILIKLCFFILMRLKRLAERNVQEKVQQSRDNMTGGLRVDI